MKSPITLLITFLFSINITNAQTIVSTRTSELQPGGYSISGNAFLEELDNGSLQLRLDDDFETPRGPDVRIFLSDNPNSTDNGIEIVDIGTGGGGINHFSGALTVDVPNGVSIDQYDFIVFYCVAFRQHWASGQFSGAMGSGGDTEPMVECQETIAATTNWGTEVTVCPNDGQADIVPLLNTQMIPPGDNYAYILTDGNNRIVEVIFESSYNFEGSGLEINRVYGVSYDGALNYTIGQNFTSITADGCAILSDNSLFLTVMKVNCNPVFECQETVAATTNWDTEVTICPNDGQADNVPLLNTLMIPPGDNYAYIITDGNNRIETVVFESSYNFEGSGLEINRVYGVSFDGTLNYSVGQNFTSITADGCVILSNNSLFLTVMKENCNPVFECQETIAATTNWATEVTICPNDGIADVVPLLNTLMIPAGDNYAYIITDANNRIEKVVSEGSYDFEGSGIGINRVFGVSFDENLNYTVGNPLTSITADGCAILSDDRTFLTVIKEDCTPAFECRDTRITTTNGVTEVTICPNDGEANVIPFLNNLMIPTGDNFGYVLTDENNRIVEVIFGGSFDFEGTGLGLNRVYGISFDSNLNYTVGSPLSTITAEGCAILSSNNAFLTIIKEDCTPPAFECQNTSITTTNGLSEVTICSSDGEANVIPFLNNLQIPTGANFGYVITNENDRIEDVIFETSYDFEGTGLGINRVYGISFDGTLDYTLGTSINNIMADGCVDISNTGNFLTVIKESCMANISGTVISQTGIGLVNFEVTLNGSTTIRTAVDGSFEFEDVPTMRDYEITVNENTPVLNGITTFDLVLIRRHILGIMTFENPYQTIAADVNSDGRVTAFDIVELQRFILGINDELPNDRSWRIVNLTGSTADALDPSSFEESATIENFNTDVTNLDFLGVRIGDVSLAGTNGLIANESRKLTNLEFNMQDAFIEAGQTIEVPVTAANFEQIVGYQFTINTTGLTFVDVKAGALAINKNNFAQLDAQTLTTVWSNEKGISTNEALFSLVFQTDEALQLSDAITFNGDRTAAVAYEASTNSRNITLAFDAAKIPAISQPQLLQNQPNPFVDETTIGFELGRDAEVLLQVFDGTGRNIFTQTGNYAKGSHQIRLTDAANFPEGLLYYQLSTGDFQMTKKMLHQR